MARTHLLFGRNVLEEALGVNAEISEVYFQNASGRIFIEETLKAHGLSTRIVREGIPKELRDQSHQGVAFRTTFEFQLRDQDLTADNFPRILLCNHLEDVQNFGAVIRSAAAFGFSLIVHESKRSVELNAVAVKTSAGLAFRTKFHEVSNLAYFAKSLQKDGYQIIALENREDAHDLYEWEPFEPLALAIGSEGEGISKTLMDMTDVCVRIPLIEGVDSLNVAQAASIALSWVQAKA